MSVRPFQYARLLLIWCLAAGLVTVYLSKGATQVMAFTAVVALAVLSHAREITHPITWFGPIFWLYSASFPLLALMGLYQYDGFMQKTVFLHALAFVAFCIPLIGCGKPLDTSAWPRERMPLRSGLAALLALAIAPLVVLMMVKLASLGVTSKRELADSGSAAAKLIQSLMVLLSLLVTIHVTCQLHRGRSFLGIGVVAVCLGGLAVVMMGERDYILRFLFVMVLLYWDFRRRPRMPTLALLFLATLMALPLLQSLKALALGGGSEYQFELASLISQEFRVAAQNTYNVMSMDLRDAVRPFEPLTWDLTRAVAPAVLGLEVQSTSAWYNKEILFDIEAGRGFTLVGYGYLVAGSFGVLALYGAVGCAFRWFYLRRGNSYLALSVYALLAPLLMYVQRGDLSTLLAQSTRGIMVPALLFALGLLIIRRVHDAERAARDAQPAVAMAPASSGFRPG